MVAGAAFSYSMSYCGSPPVLDTLWTRWNLDPVLIAVLVGCALLGMALLRGAGDKRQIAFALAWLVAVVLFVSPLCALTVALFSARIVHHGLLMMVAAPLLVLAMPRGWRAPLGLLPALVLSSIILWLWHVPDFYVATFQHPAIYWAMQVSLLGSACWLWLALLRGPALLSGGAALVSSIQMGLLGALLVFAPQPLYLPHLATTSTFGLTPLEDQQLAGLILWVPANVPLLMLALWRLLESLGHRAGVTHAQ